MTPFFLELVTVTDEARRAFESHPVIADSVAHGMSVERYRHLLCELYHVVWHFNPVSAAAAARLTDAHRPVRYYLYEHMLEERGHEQWVLADLQEMGVPNSQALAYQPAPDTLALLGYNYWAVEHRHPCAALGMLYVLEVIASVYGGPFTTALKEALLLQDDRGTSFIGSHATLDAEHMATLREVLNTLVDEAARAAVVESATVNFHLFTRVMGAV